MNSGPSAGITGPRLQPVLDKQGLFAVNFSCCGFDGGNKRIKGLSKRILKCVGPNDIIALHDTKPKSEDLFVQWLEEVELILSGLKAKDLAILPLSDLIEKPIMALLNGSSDSGG